MRCFILIMILYVCSQHDETHVVATPLIGIRVGRRCVHIEFSTFHQQLNPCFGRHVKPLVPAAFAVVSTHQPALGLRGGLWPVLLCVIHKEGLCPSSGDINRLMMMKPGWVTS
jgi:hypothetical protein